MSLQEDCEYWRGLLALDAVGQLEEADRGALLGHVQGCARCRAERFELAATVSALALAEGTFLDEGMSTDDLSTLPSLGPLGGLDAESTEHPSDAIAQVTPRGTRSGRTLRHGLIGLSAAVAAGLVVVAGSLGVVGGSPSPARPVAVRTVTLHGAAGSYGTAVLVPKPWGTSIELDDHVRSATPQVLTVSMRTPYGRPWLAGTYRTVASGYAQMTLACALPLTEIQGVTVTDSSGHEVLQS